MEQYTTFKKLIDKLEEFANRHPNINSFGFGNLVEFGKDVENTTPLYPLLFVVPQTINYNEGITEYGVQIFLADKLNDDNEGSVSIVSEMSLISKDLLGVFKLNEDFMYLADFDFPITATPFLERFNDVLAGVSMSINFSVSDYLDVCQLNDIFDGLQIGIGYRANNVWSAYYSWQRNYPDFLVQDLETGNIERVITQFDWNTSDDCGGYDEALGQSISYEIQTGSTWAGFKLFLDEEQITDYGYTLGRYDGLPSVTGITFTNFAQSFIPTYYSATRTYHYDDGTEYTTNVPIAFRKDGLPTQFFISLKGNESAQYQLSFTQYTGSTFQEACDNYYGRTADIKRIYYPYANDLEYWWNQATGSTSTYSLTKCIQTPNDSDFFIAQYTGFDLAIASANTEGNLVYVDNCIPPTPTPTPTATNTPTPTLTPNPACPQQIVISDTTNGSVIPNGSYNELTFAGTEYGYFSGGTFFTGTAPDGNNYKVFGIQPSSTYYTYCWDVVNEDWGVGRSNYAYLGQGGTYTGGAWLGASTSVVFGSEYLPGTGSKGLFTTYYLSYPVLCPTPSITPTSSLTPTPTGTPTPTPTMTPTPSAVITYNLLTESGDGILTENGDNIRREQDI